MFKSASLCALVLAAVAYGAPQAASNASSSIIVSSSLPSSTLSSTATISSPASLSLSAPPEFETDPPASDDPNFPIFSPEADPNPEPIRGSLGATVIGPQNIPMDMQNPDILAPPSSDAGEVPTAKWPFSLSHNRLQTGGWARQQNTKVFPFASDMASVDMRLEAGAIRELHWHTTDEWAIVLKGYTQVTAVNQFGQNFIDTVGPGDLWYFPAGVPHSLQATDQDPDGTEFILIFPNGSFDEDGTFLLTDWLSHVPKEVLAKNFQINISEFDRVPSQELYIFPSVPPSPTQQNPVAPNGTVPQSFTFHFSDVTPTQLNGGTIKVVDTRTFPVATEVVGALVTVEPGAMRQWHPTEPEWDFFLQGSGRMTLFAAEGNANTFDFVPGDIGYVPPTYGHYVENIGNTTMIYLEIFNAPLVQDISLQQWLALIPPELVQAHLGIDLATIQNFNKTKQTVVF